MDPNYISRMKSFLDPAIYPETASYLAWMQGKTVLVGDWQEHGPKPAKPIFIPTPRGNRSMAIIFDEYMDWVKVRHASIPLGIVGRRVSIEAARP